MTPFIWVLTRTPPVYPVVALYHAALNQQDRPFQALQQFTDDGEFWVDHLKLCSLAWVVAELVSPLLSLIYTSWAISSGTALARPPSAVIGRSQAVSPLLLSSP